MKNKHLKDLNKIEFVLTYACTGRCKHCSEGDHKPHAERINPDAAIDAVRKICAEYDIKTLLVFGGEPLIYKDAVYAIMSVAKELNIEKRQIITNGYFSSNLDEIRAVAKRLGELSVNDLLISADAFHQEYIPLDTVLAFAKEAKSCEIPTRLSPAWLVSPTDDNPYNRKTREILDRFSALQIPIGEGNVIFPEGNAKKYLAEYFCASAPENPYVEDPCNVKCISFEPNGNVLDGNIYRCDVMEIINGYKP